MDSLKDLDSFVITVDVYSDSFVITVDVPMSSFKCIKE
jgi:hypothetical protein